MATELGDNSWGFKSNDGNGSLWEEVHEHKWNVVETNKEKKRRESSRKISTSTTHGTSVSKNGYGQLMDRKFVGYGQS